MMTGYFQLVFLSLIVCYSLVIGGTPVVRREAGSTTTEAKICVPRKFINECGKLYGEGSGIKCVAARDRMQCLEVVKRREADFMVVDPEDMYVAYHIENEDYDIISEIRTVEEQHNPFRYDGIILIKKGSGINAIKDLKGKKSCHTGYGRNVGYKIPLTKLRKHDVLKLSDDPELTSSEKELEALSKFFEKSCLVGDYSPDKLVDQILKKRYSNLCELCEDPQKCNYPDKYSGYAGAVRCLVEGQGDVAFTKTYHVKQFFGLPIAAGSPSNPRSDVAEYEYLCEDGSRSAITDPTPCSWAQRPWQGYMTNSDVISMKAELQPKLSSTYEAGKTKLNATERLAMAIKPDWAVYGTSEVITPGKHLFKAQYKDVIERDGTEQGVIRFCVTSEKAALKCKWLKRAAYSRDIRPQLECLMKDTEQCIQAVSKGKADALVLPAKDIHNAESNGLLQIMSELYDDVYVGLIDAAAGSLDSPTVEFDHSNPRSLTAALNFYVSINQKTCTPTSTSSNPTVKIVSSKSLAGITGKKLLCVHGERKELSEYQTCNLDYSLPNGVFVRKSETRQVKDNIKHAFVSIGQTFGTKGNLNDVFDLFGEFEGHSDVIFSSDAVDIVPDAPQMVDKKTYFGLHCIE